MTTPPVLHRARQLRWNMSAPERLLWALLRGKQTGLRFRRQHPVGSYVLDFYCPSAKLCVELDGPSHDEPAQAAHDASRDAWLRAHGITVLRFSTAQLTEPAAVLNSIRQAAPPPSASPPPPPR